uniref:Uncharacterized protein n=1 Tax=Globisporangium ultimum (strain ATCC 200006 / CBS 805.95 / DAOM BR144) TaxID=431595 RepID=K3X2V9_GLOUD
IRARRAVVGREAHSKAAERVQNRQVYRSLRHLRRGRERSHHVFRRRVLGRVHGRGPSQHGARVRDVPPAGGSGATDLPRTQGHALPQWHEHETAVESRSTYI